MGKNIFETLMGAVVLIVAIGFIIIAYQGGKVNNVNGYILSAKFDRIDGLTVGSDVRVSGLKVGQIITQTIDPKTYQAIVKFEMSDDVKLPRDSNAEIISDGLLGSKYLALVPGGDMVMLNDGDEISFTQASISIESLIGKFMFGGAGDDQEMAAKDESTKDEDDIF